MYFYTYHYNIFTFIPPKTHINYNIKQKSEILTWYKILKEKHSMYNIRCTG